MNEQQGTPLTASEALGLSQDNADSWAEPIFRDIRARAKQGSRTYTVQDAVYYSSQVRTLDEVEALLRRYGYHTERETHFGYRKNCSDGPQAPEKSRYGKDTLGEEARFEHFSEKILRVIW